MSEPRVGQIWKMCYSDIHFVFITDINHDNAKVSFYYIDDPKETAWEWKKAFIKGVYYKLVNDV